jgi:hypothetical protein
VAEFSCLTNIKKISLTDDQLLTYLNIALLFLYKITGELPGIGQLFSAFQHTVILPPGNSGPGYPLFQFLTDAPLKNCSIMYPAKKLPTGALIVTQTFP